MSEFLGLMSLLVSWALADSVDPCIFALFVSILTSASLINIGSVVRVGVSFIASTFVGYMLFGFVIRILAGGLPRWVMSLVMLVYGVTSLLSAIRGDVGKQATFVCREDELPCRVVNALRLVEMSRAEVIPTIIIGVIASFTLLPCSAGLYILYNTIMSQYGFLVWLPLTTLYVIIFELPLILILLVFIGVSKVRRVSNVLSSSQRLVKILGATIMISASLYLLLTS